MCGSQRCPADKEAISTCEHYKGDIEGVPKKENISTLFNLARERETHEV